jgi:CPA1 family monovalent cation:H+ antiporter
LQLPAVLHHLSGHTSSQLVWYVVLISLAVIVIRILWVFPATYLPRVLVANIRRRDPCPAWQHVTIVAWTGMRGVVSLAAALALPLTLKSGSAFPGRELILFLTFVVILATLVVQGLSLPFIIRWLDVKDDQAEEKEERHARLQANRSALARIEELVASAAQQSEPAQRLRSEYEERIHQLESSKPETNRGARGLFSSDYEKLSIAALEVERKTIHKLRDELVINDEVLRRIQRDIDLAEARLGEPS